MFLKIPTTHHFVSLFGLLLPTKRKEVVKRQRYQSSKVFNSTHTTPKEKKLANLFPDFDTLSPSSVVDVFVFRHTKTPFSLFLIPTHFFLRNVLSKFFSFCVHNLTFRVIPVPQLPSFF